MALPSPKFRGFLRRAWNSERAAPVRFYGRYFRGPLLLLAMAATGAKLVGCGALPLAGIAGREWAYFQAERAFRGGRDTEALYQIRQALLNTRDNARLWRLAARISGRLNSPEEAYCWQQVDRLEPGRLATQLALAGAALRHDELELADAALHEVPLERQGGLDYLVEAGRLARAQGDAARADFFLEQVEALHPGDPAALFALADWRAARGDAPRARSILEELTDRPAERATALRKLVDLGLQQRDLPAARQAETKLLALPQATWGDRVRQLDLSSGSASVDATLESLLGTRSPAGAACVLDWMTAHGGAERALIWIREQDETWQDDPDIGLARAGCLEALGDWDHLRDDQLDSRWPGREPARLMVLAQASRALGQMDDARAAWHEAVATCAQPADYLALAQAAADFHDGGEARAEVWIALANRYPGQEWPLRSLLGYELRRGDLVAAQGVAERISGLAPGDLAIDATRDLLQLERRSEMPQAESDLARLETRAPGDPTVATAAAYALYRQGRFGDALAAIGALEPAELRAPERAEYIGQLLAVAGPVRQAEAALQTALAQPGLLDGQRCEIERALDLVAARRVLADWLHPPSSAARDRARAFFLAQAPAGKPVFLMGAGMALTGDRSRAAAALAQIDATALNGPERLLDEGAVLALAGSMTEAGPYLTLSPNLPFQSPNAAWHRMVETWWTIENRAAFDPAVTAGLLAAYRGLEETEPDPAFWRRDQARETALARAALQAGQDAGAVRTRLEALLRHVPATPELEAQIGYALFLEGRVEAGRQRIEVLSPLELARPEPARYYAAILRACGEPKRAETYALLAAREESGKAL
jgi:Flp pilus assembly protein TadD